MAAASETYHEPFDLISDETKELHRAIVSAQEELEAIDWYRQRADVSGNAALRAILVHNMEEEMEHFAMVLEWLRRHSSHLDTQLRTYLFHQGDIVDAEEEVMGGRGNGDSSSGDTGDFTIGKLEG